MNPIFFCLVTLCCATTLTLASSEKPASEQSASSEAAAAAAAVAAAASLGRKDVHEEMQLINKSLEGLLSELATIKREATGRLSQSKNRLAASNNPEQIRQTKVSRFVLKRISELELESMGMRDEMVKLFELQNKTLAAAHSATGQLLQARTETRQEDLDFDNDQPQQATTTGGASGMPATATAAAATTTTTTTTTMKPEEEAAQIGFDLEQLKRLGKELESEIETRQAQNPESLRGVHEQVIRLVDNMVQNYLGNMRRTVQRVTNFIDNTRGRNTASSASSQPRQSPEGGAVGDDAGAGSAKQLGESIVNDLQDMTKRFREFTLQWSKALGKQQSPLFDRIPPRGIEMWRDFWDTIRKQVRRINTEVWQLSRDMTRVLTGRLPATEAIVIVRPGGRGQQQNLADLLYAAAAADQSAGSAPRLRNDEQILKQEFDDFYNKLTVQLRHEEKKMNELSKASGQALTQQQVETSNLIDELDDEQTKNELANNVALRQQIQQDINIFGSIFDIMRTFIQRLRESATNIRDVLQPPGAIHSNNPVTPGPDVKPTVDQLLQETVNSQRNINSQAKPRSM